VPRLAALLFAGLIAAGCGDGSSPLGPGSGVHREPNATDAAFVRAMVPHQTSGVAAARIAGRRARRSELRAIGREIADRQAPTIERLRALTPPPDVARAGGPIGGRPEPIDPRRLRDPVSFDHEFMTMMIRHHEGSLAMTDEEQDRGADDRLKRLAAEIYRSQKDELERLRRFLHTWYGEDGPQGPGGGAPGGSPPDT
jgi:uncharacterized protein (DUF305 family)